MDKYIYDNDNENWTRMPFVIDIDTSKDFQNLSEVLLYTTGDDSVGASLKGVHDDVDGAGSQELAARPFLADTRVGWNDAINVLWQFNRDDDIIHPINMSSDGHGMGRVYTDMIERHQRIMWISFGVPEFSGMLQFYMKSINIQMANLMRSGEGDAAFSIGSFIGATAGTALTLPFMPFVWLGKLVGSMGAGTMKITRYYDFKTAMPLYYQMVTSILSSLAVNMGFIGGFGDGGTGGTDKSMPPIMYRTNGDIYRILSQRPMYKDSGTLGTDKSSLDLLRATARTNDQIKANEANNKGNENGSEYMPGSSFGDTFLQSAKESMFGAMMYVGFRIEKTTDASESFSNNTGESSLAQQINSQVADAQSNAFSAMGGSTGFKPLDSAISGIKGFVSAFGDATGTAHFINAYSGIAYVDIPEVWQNSSFGKSYSFEIQLRAPYGDPVSIYQSIYIPLAMWLAGSLPRMAGNNAYTTPFILRMYCKGMFALPLGMVESLSVRRGSSEYGWNIDSLPTQIDLSISIKDLSPAMYVGLASGNIIDEISKMFAQNTSFQEYLMTLAGMGLSERILFLNNIKRKFEILLTTLRNTYGNPLYWGNRIGDSGILRTVAAFYPKSALPTN